jgi:outer membrane protein OmpA-like peptidoglycan-associated protein
MGVPGSVLEFGGETLDQQLATQSFAGQASGFSVRDNAHETRITLEADVLFEFDQADIRPSWRRLFTRLPTSSELMEPAQYV